MLLVLYCRGNPACVYLGMPPAVRPSVPFLLSVLHLAGKIKITAQPVRALDCLLSCTASLFLFHLSLDFLPAYLLASICSMTLLMYMFFGSHP